MNRSDRRSRGGHTGSIFERSFVLRALMRFADWFYLAVGQSVFGTVLTSYHRLEAAFGRSRIGTGAREAKFARGPFMRHLKNRIAKTQESSFLTSVFSRFTEALWKTGTRTVAFFFLSLGTAFCGVEFLRVNTFRLATRGESVLMIGISLIVLSLPLFFSQRNLGGDVCDSTFLRSLFFDFLDYRQNRILTCAEEKPVNRFSSAFLLTLLLAAFSVVIPPLSLVIAALVILLIALILVSPESGLILTFFFLPFLTTMQLVGFICVIFLSFLMKLICGRRIFKLTLIDFCVLGFALFVISGGIFSVSTSSIPKMLVYACFLLGYFLVKNIVRSSSLSHRCLCAAVGSVVPVSLYGLYQNFFGTLSTTWQDTAMFADIRGRAVSTFENPNVLGEFLILLLPVALALMIASKRANERFFFLIAAALDCACLVFTWSRGAWLGFLITFVLFLCLYDKRFFAVGILLAPLCVSLLMLGAETSVVRRISSIGSVADSSTSYRFGIWRGVFAMLGDVFLFGIGIGEGAFSRVYPFYSLSGIEAAPHSHNLYLQIVTETGLFSLLLFLAAMFFFIQQSLSYAKRSASAESRVICLGILCGILAFLIQGATDYVFYNYRIFLLFWLLVGLGVAHVNTSESSEEAQEIY